jgi:protein-tyrosine phosphatase
MWSSFSERAAQATKGFSDALEKTGEAITQAATKPKAKTTTNIPEGDEDATIERTMSDNGEETPVAQQRLPDKDKLLKGLQMGWTSMVDSTKQVVEETRNAIDAQQHRFEQGLQNTLLNRKKGFYKRDPSLPLDVEALRDAEVVYITDRIITMSHPAMASNQNPNITGGRKLAAVGHLLHRRHDGRYLVWNLSEMDYDISILNDQVLTFSFPGSPCPPLGLLLKLLVSMENWMKADDRNVAVVHCLTGKGRTSTVLAAFLCWMGQAGFGDINEALAYIAKCKKMTPEQLTIPSQRRYALYFKNMLDGVRPSQPPLLLKRIIMSEAPRVRSFWIIF